LKPYGVKLIDNPFGCLRISNGKFLMAEPASFNSSVVGNFSIGLTTKKRENGLSALFYLKISQIYNKKKKYI